MNKENMDVACPNQSVLKADAEGISGALNRRYGEGAGHAGRGYPSPTCQRGKGGVSPMIFF